MVSIGDRLLNNSAKNVRASRGFSRVAQVANVLVVILFTFFAVAILAANGSDGVGAALFCLGIALLSAGAWWFRRAGTKRADSRP